MMVLHLARKPLSESSVAANILAHGTGAVNVDACRVGTHQNTTPSGMDRYNALLHARGYRPGAYPQGTPETSTAVGRWPANVVLQHLPGCSNAGTRRVVPKEGHRPNPVGVQADGQIVFNHKPPGYQKTSYTMPDGTEEMDAWACEPGCPVAELDAQSGERPVSGAAKTGRPARGGATGAATVAFGIEEGNGTLHNDAGGASRYYKQVGGDRS